VAHIGKIRKACKVLVRTPEGNKPLGRPKHRWEDNNRIYFKEIEWKGVDWIWLAQDKGLVNVVVNLQVP
jgi:hypothetical protein